jgi:hypothetical protein
MKTIIINGQRELAELPELWYTDGTDEANEWGEKLANSNHKWGYKHIRNCKIGGASADNRRGLYEERGHTYITPSEFLRLVYEPWKESQKVKLPNDYSQLRSAMLDKSIDLYGEREYLPNHINACIQLTNIMNFANDAFEGDGKEWVVYDDGSAFISVNKSNPIRFTSKAAAEWAYKTFPEIFKAYWNV